MTIVITKTKLAIGILAMALIGTTAAMAVDDNPFTDVPDSEGTEARFFSEPVEWLWDNGLTTGTSANTFSPDDNVTRGQYAAFNFRYDQNIVQPALSEIEDNVATVAGDVGNATRVYFARVAADGEVEQTSTQELTVAKTGTGVYEVTIPEPADNCTTLATAHFQVEVADGFGQLALAFNEGNIVTFHITDDPNPDDEIDVITYTGDPALATDMPFSITVFCSDPEFVVFNPGVVIPPIIVGP